MDMGRLPRMSLFLYKVYEAQVVNIHRKAA